jgi:hypothetical protein
VALAALQLVWIAPAWADDAQRIQELERQLARSLSLIEQLNQRVQQLEGQRGTALAAPVQAPAAAPAAVPMGHMDHMAPAHEFAGNSVPARDTGIPIHAFSDVNYVSGRSVAGGARPGFALGNLDLYFSPEIGPRLRSLVELVFEYGPDGLSTDLERLEFGYVFSDAATLWAGRWHTPYGYWNDAFHHGGQMQTAASRPRFLDFEDRGGILPAHGIGLLLQGSARTGSGRVQYDGYVANGDAVKDRVLDMNTFGDDNGNKLVGGNVRYSFAGALDGLMLGVHAFTHDVASYSGPVQTGRTRVNMAGGFAVYDANNWEVMSEYYRFRDHDRFAGTGSHSSWAAFAQVGYTFLNVWTPYYRWEKASLDQGDDYFAAQESGRSYRQNVLGVRYNLNQNAALKLELTRMDETQVDGSAVRSNGARFQFAVRF